MAAGLLAGACSDGGTPKPASTTNKPTQESGSQPVIDTSDWPTVSSPLGFELQYPPDWTLDIVSDSQMRILNPAYKKAIDDATAAGLVGVGLPPIPGASQFSVIADISPGFDVDHLISSCGNDAFRATLLGRAAIHCPGTGTLTDTLSSAGHSYWVEFPPGHTMLVGGSVISEDAPDLAVVEAILSTFRFTDEPPVDTSDWPTFSSPLGFNIKYPPEWTVQEGGADHVYIRNERAVAERERRIAGGTNEFPDVESGEAWLYLGPGPPGDYDLEGLIQVCGSPSPEEVIFAGQLSLRCGRIIYASMPGGGIFQVLTAVNGGDLTASHLIDAALQTASFISVQ